MYAVFSETASIYSQITHGHFQGCRRNTISITMGVILYINFVKPHLNMNPAAELSISQGYMFVLKNVVSPPKIFIGDKGHW